MNGLQNKKNPLGNIVLPTELLSRGQDAIAKTLSKSEGIKIHYTVRLGNPETQELFVADTENARVYISGFGDEADGISSIPKIGIPKEFIKVGQPILVRKNASGNFKYVGIDTDTAESYNAGDEDAHNQMLVDVSQLDFGTLRPYSGLVATVKGAIYGDDAVTDLSTADFSASPLDTLAAAINIPTTANTAIGVLVQLDPATSTLSYKQSASFDADLTLSEAYKQGLLPLRDDDLKRIGYLKLSTGITTFDNSNIWTFPEFFPEIGGGIEFPPATTLTISGGVVTVTQSFHSIDTEGGAASDDLDTINGMVAGQLYILKMENVARVVTLQHGTGNIRMFGINDIVMNALNKQVLIFYDGTTANVIGNIAMPNDVEPWAIGPDNDLKFAAQDLTEKIYYLTGSEMRSWISFLITTDVTLDYFPYHFVFNSATDRTITVNAGTVADGIPLQAHAIQVSGGTGHKILLPANTYWNETGTNRAILLGSVGSRVEATAVAVGGGVTRLLVKGSNAVTFAAS